MIRMPNFETLETATARTARQKRDAADRAREHRQRQRAELEGLRARVAELEPLVARVAELGALVMHAEVDALVVAGLARAIARAPGHRDEAPVAGLVSVPAILDQCGKAGRAAGAHYASCAHAAGGRLQKAVRQFAPAKRPAS